MVNSEWKDRLNAAVKHGLIEKNSSLENMLESSDKENKDLAKEILRLNIGEELMKGLNSDQTNAFIDIIDFFRDPDADAFVLKGYAGTGKTFLIKRIIEYIRSGFPFRRIAVTAPTNKAVQVLTNGAAFGKGSTEITRDLFSKEDGESMITYATIHSLLGLKEKITDDGEQIFVADKMIKTELSKFKYLIVDEVSMLDDDLCKKILTSDAKIKIIFMGDPAQIPPIKAEHCIPFSKGHGYNFKEAELKQIMRQKGENAIVDYSFIIRDNLTLKQPIPKIETKLNKEGSGVIHIDAKTERSNIRPLLHKMFNDPRFKQNSDFAKVIAWRNVNVNYLNSVVREVMYGKDINRFVVGEKLVVNKPIFEKKNFNKKSEWVIQFYTSEELTVTKVGVVKKDFREQNIYATLIMWELTVEYMKPGVKTPFTAKVYTVHEDSKADYQELLEEQKNLAIKIRNSTAWIKYFNIQKWDANVSYNYAITAHKSQGSTYTNVLLIEEDIDYNQNVVERNRIKYTAYTRPTNKLFILR